jgi:3-oxoacyl-(acyl-carrier-protein) synthase
VDNFLISKLTSSIKTSINRISLDLRGLVVVTECATGVYACTPAIAALAGARKVVAFGKDSFYGTFKNAQDDV